MKNTIKKTIGLILLVTVMIAISTSCGPDPEPEKDDKCDYQGFTYTNTSNNSQTSIPEAELTTELFPSSSSIEIYKTTDPGNMNFSTGVITDGGTGTGTLNYNGSTISVNVTCQKAGTAVGDEFRYDVTGTNLEAQFCVEVDQVH